MGKIFQCTIREKAGDLREMTEDERQVFLLTICHTVQELKYMYRLLVHDFTVRSKGLAYADRYAMRVRILKAIFQMEPGWKYDQE